MRACGWLGCALYTVFLLGAPLAHHDLTSHRTKPAHCPACIAAQPGPDVPFRIDVVATELPRLGPVDVCPILAGDTWLPPAMIGRAPPLLSS
jgi:hypothetical protein